MEDYITCTHDADHQERSMKDQERSMKDQGRSMKDQVRSMEGLGRSLKGQGRSMEGQGRQSNLTGHIMMMTVSLDTEYSSGEVKWISAINKHEFSVALLINMNLVWHYE
ncbi:hypothetical protein BsWGS_04007 [Bradybaena similaris]